MNDKDKEKQKRLNEVYRYVYGTDGIDSQTAFANKVGVQRTVMSAAMNGNKLYLTKNLFMKVCAAFPNKFNLDYLLTGEGTLLMEKGSVQVTEQEVNEIETLKGRIKVLEEQVNRQRQLIDHYESFVNLLTRMQNDINRPFTPDNTPANILDNQ